MVLVDDEVFQRTNEDWMVRVMDGPNKNAKKCIDSLVDRLPRKYIGAALTSEK